MNSFKLHINDDQFQTIDEKKKKSMPGEKKKKYYKQF